MNVIHWIYTLTYYQSYIALPYTTICTILLPPLIGSYFETGNSSLILYTLATLTCLHRSSTINQSDYINSTTVKFLVVKLLPLLLPNTIPNVRLRILFLNTIRYFYITFPSNFKTKTHLVRLRTRICYFFIHICEYLQLPWIKSPRIITSRWKSAIASYILT